MNSDYEYTIKTIWRAMIEYQNEILINPLGWENSGAALRRLALS